MMRLLTSCGLVLILASHAPAQEAPTPNDAPDPATVREHSSYGLGYRTGGEFGEKFGSFGIAAGDLARESFMKGFLDGLGGEAPAVADADVQAAMQAFGNLLQAREEKVAAANLEAGQAFLAENREAEGVRTLDSGLQYKVLEPGDGETYRKPAEGEPAKQFRVHYEGTLIDGTVFDASPEGQPVTMTLQVIDGIKEALTTMPVGAKWQCFIPSDLAYGEQRRSATIGPNSTLVFELELLAIEDTPAPSQGGLPFPMPGQ
jgi:FKBP-type peptidyl-prolyl cis-trans isomerase